MLEQLKQKVLELNRVFESIMIRRTTLPFENILPERHDYIVMIRPSDLRLFIYQYLMESRELKKAHQFSLISDLKQLCFSPKLIIDKYPEISNEILK